jgi:hypothetical protein
MRIAEGIARGVLIRENFDSIYRAPVRVLTDAKDGTSAFLPGRRSPGANETLSLLAGVMVRFAARTALDFSNYFGKKIRDGAR